MTNEAWYILITEETNNARRQLTHKEQVAGDITAARALALRRAREYSPQHPRNQKGRAVFQTSYDSWTVEVNGATSSFFFTVEVAQLV